MINNTTCRQVLKEAMNQMCDQNNAINGTDITCMPKLNQIENHVNCVNNNMQNANKGFASGGKWNQQIAMFDQTQQQQLVHSLIHWQDGQKGGCSHCGGQGSARKQDPRDLAWLFDPEYCSWPKQSDATRNGNGSGSQEEDNSLKTTMMLRNIPNKYTQKMMLEYLENNGFRGTYDFFYLPIDFRNRCNVGYAFINFVDPEHAKRFLQSLHRVKLPAYNSNKVCEVTYAHVQGLEQNVEHYRNSPVNGIPISAYRPMIFKSGLEVGFPKPDAPLPPIQLRPAKC